MAMLVRSCPASSGDLNKTSQFQTSFFLENGHQQLASWHKMCSKSSVEITNEKINRWIEVDRKRKARAERHGEFFYHVRQGARRTFIFLLIAAIGVFALNHRVEIKTIALAKLQNAAKKSAESNGLRQSALDYEKQVNDAA